MPKFSSLFGRKSICAVCRFRFTFSCCFAAYPIRSRALQIEPQVLQIPFELKKQISRSIRLSNKTDDYVAFKVMTTNPKKYCVNPIRAVVLPHSTFDVIVTMRAQEEAPLDMMQCIDKFLIRSMVVSPGATDKDLTAEMGIKYMKASLESPIYVAPP